MMGVLMGRIPERCARMLAYLKVPYQIPQVHTLTQTHMLL